MPSLVLKWCNNTTEEGTKTDPAHSSITEPNRSHVVLEVKVAVCQQRMTSKHDSPGSLYLPASFYSYSSCSTSTVCTYVCLVDWSNVTCMKNTRCLGSLFVYLFQYAKTIIQKHELWKNNAALLYFERVHVFFCHGGTVHDRYETNLVYGWLLPAYRQGERCFIKR